MPREHEMGVSDRSFLFMDISCLEGWFFGGLFFVWCFWLVFVVLVVCFVFL